MSAAQIQTKKLNDSYGYKDSFVQWWNRHKLDSAEEQVLSMLSFYPESDGHRVAKVEDVAIDSKNYIHEFNVKNIDDASAKDEDILLIHGYGAALGFFYRNFGDLTTKPGANLHAIDLLGYGLSSRPSLPKFKKVSIQDVEQVEEFFIDSIEKWRVKRQIEKFHLIGHSLGAYLSSLYALKYPEHVQKLVLISPVGVERSVYELDMDQSNASQDFVKGPDIEEEVGVSNAPTDQPARSSSLHVPDANGYVRRLPNFPSWIVFLWERHVSPFSVLRIAGPLGPYVSSRWSFRRFGFVGDHQEILKLHNYSYDTFVAKGSGEYALSRLLAPGALARYPLLNRLPKKLKVDSLWLYGDSDWMSKEAGKTIVDAINENGQVHADYKIISNAGHHVYLDNPSDLKSAVFKFLKW